MKVFGAQFGSSCCQVSITIIDVFLYRGARPLVLWGRIRKPQYVLISSQ